LSTRPMSMPLCWWRANATTVSRSKDPSGPWRSGRARRSKPTSSATSRSTGSTSRSPALNDVLPKHLLPIIPAGLTVLEVMPMPDLLTITTSPRQKSAPCPTCGEPSPRVHSRYLRQLHDLPWQGRAVTIRVQARRFRCASSSCPRRTFAEHLQEIAGRSARRTERLGELQRHLGLALGGAASARLAQRLAMPTSPDTLLRFVHRAA